MILDDSQNQVIRTFVVQISYCPFITSLEILIEMHYMEAEEFGFPTKVVQIFLE